MTAVINTSRSNSRQSHGPDNRIISRRKQKRLLRIIALVLTAYYMSCWSSHARAEPPLSARMSFQAQRQRQQQQQHCHYSRFKSDFNLKLTRQFTNGGRRSTRRGHLLGFSSLFPISSSGSCTSTIPRSTLPFASTDNAPPACTSHHHGNQCNKIISSQKKIASYLLFMHNSNSHHHHHLSENCHCNNVISLAAKSSSLIECEDEHSNDEVILNTNDLNNDENHQTIINNNNNNNNSSNFNSNSTSSITNTQLNTTKNATNKPRKNNKQRPRIPILSYQSTYAILSKPTGMTMHHNANTHWGRSKSPVLQTTIQKQLSRKPFLVHRLDHRTSGAVIVAFDSRSAGVLHGRLRGGRRGNGGAKSGSVKLYLALVRGDLRKRFQDVYDNDGNGRLLDANNDNVVDDDGCDIIANRTTATIGKGTIASEYKAKITVNLALKMNNDTKDALTDFYFLSSMTYNDTAATIAMDDSSVIPPNGTTNAKTTTLSSSSSTKTSSTTKTPYITKSLTLLLCHPRTGRTHQIRRHLQKSLQSPIIGDSEHGDSRVNRFWRERIGLDRLGLHCWYLDLPAVENDDDDGDDAAAGMDDDDNCANNNDGVDNNDAYYENQDLKSRIQCIAPLPVEFSTALQSEELKPLWEEAIRIEPRLAMEPYDERGGSFGRSFRKRRGAESDDGDSATAAS